jgi:DNA ligase-4
MFYSFFKVCGGFRADDCAAIKRKADGFWIEWNRKNPPSEYITIGAGPDGQFERLDV